MRRRSGSAEELRSGGAEAQRQFSWSNGLPSGKRNICVSQPITSASTIISANSQWGGTVKIFELQACGPK